MKERPVTLDAAAVRATLDNRKTQLRVPVKLREFGPSETYGYDWTFRDRRGLWNDYTTTQLLSSKFCPVHVGDRLRVRETWSMMNQDRTTVILRGYHRTPEEASGLDVVYRADEDHGHRGWRSPVLMPRWASRLALEVTEVRLQRLQEITDEDARAEGARELPLQEGEPGAWWTCDVIAGQPLHARDPIWAYRKLWGRRYGKRSPWDRNDWVWAYTYRRAS